MLKNLNMAGKMALGFGFVLVIIAVIIIITITNMLNIHNLANQMDKEYLPEVNIATNLERNSLQTMYNMRGYALNFNNNYRVEAKQYIKNIEKDIEDAKALSAKYPNQPTVM